MADRNPYKKRNSFQHLVAEYYLAGMSAHEAKRIFEPTVRAQTDSRMIFNGHTPNGFGPLPMYVQLRRMEAMVDRTYRDLQGRGIKPNGDGEDMEKWSPDTEGGGGFGEQENPEAGENPLGGEGRESAGDGEGEPDDTPDPWDGDAEKGGESEGEGEGDEGEESESEKQGEGEGEESEGEDEASEASAESDADGESEEGKSEPPPPPPKKSEDDDWKWYVSEVKRIHAWCQERAESGEWVDDFGMRPLIDGAKAYKYGIPGKALIHAMTLHWSEETRAEAGIRKFRPESLDSRRKPPRDRDGKLLHPLSRYVFRLAKARIPIMLVGPKGAGKSHLARDVADLLTQANGREYPYGETPMTAGASPSWLIGGETMSGFKTRPFLEIYRDGGVFSFEEVDAADPNMTIVLNNALASTSFYNPANGQVLHRSPDFVAIATANTFGLGANRDYTGRERLDGAFLDRFRMGRVYVDLDWDLGEEVSSLILDGEA